jgi:type I restriction enzyme S subunit
MSKNLTLDQVLDDAEVFIDGDWVESKDQDPNGDVRLTQLADIGDGYWIDKSNRFMTAEKAKKLKCTYLQVGDILVARMPDPIGRCCEYPGAPMPAVTVVDVCVIRPNRNKVVSRYLMHGINAPLVRHQILQHVTGTTRQRISRGNLKKLEIPLPPLAEQKRIAAILDAADALRTKRREALAQLDALLQSTFLTLFGDPVENPIGWDTVFVDNVCNLVRGSSPRPQGDARYFGGNVPRLMVADITRDGFKVTPNIDSLTEEGAKRSRPVPKGTVVMAVSGNVGLVATVQVPCCVHDGFVAFLELDRKIFDSTYFMFQFHFLKATHENRKAGAIFQNITTTDIKRMLIALPPLPLQQKFAAIVESVERQKAAQRTHLAELDALFAALQHRAFRGEL